MNYGIILRTIRHLKLKQLFYQVKNRVCKVKYLPLSAPAHGPVEFQTEPIPRFQSKEGQIFTFLNQSHSFTNWNFVEYGTLFTYNQNYFDFINDGIIDKEDALRWIDRFISEISTIKLGMDPYPIALRSMNWIKFFSKYPESINKERDDSLWSQLKLLQKKLEFHLLGNHLLEDFYALYIGGCYFQDNLMINESYRLLVEQLNEQTLPDGAHYEQSPMYHAILLDRLLDCINIRPTDELKNIAIKQLCWLQEICYCDGTFPMFNDSAKGISPDPTDIFDYAHRLGLEWGNLPMKECGYRKFKNNNMEVVVDVGNITATYQPGHSHADALTYEIRKDNKPYIVDTGISTYEKNRRRHFERSTMAHNCVSPDGRNSSEVWGGFRIGSYCDVKIIEDKENSIYALHNGFDKSCKRKFQILNDSFSIEDWYDGNAVSYIHLAEGVDESCIDIDHAISIQVKDYQYSTIYNEFHTGKVIEICFNGYLKYTIR